MLNLHIKLVLLLFIYKQVTCQISWQPGNWAFGCDFYGNDLQSQQIPGEQCGTRCSQTPGCTHFTHVQYNGGTCYMKKGQVSKSDAVYTGDNSMVCGIVGSGGDIVVDTSSTTRRTTVSGDTSGDKFPNCQLKWGRDYVGDNVDYSQWDYITIWIGAIKQGCPDAFSQDPSCTDFNDYWAGAMMKKTKAAGKIPVFYGYIIAFEARNLQGLSDCNVYTQYPSLCEQGANFIRNNRERIISRYAENAAKVAEFMGPSTEAIFLIEPDFWQYWGDYKQQGGTLSGQYMRSLYDDIANGIKSKLPKALISWDISPWISENDMRTWWGFFSDSKNVDIIHTSGGGHYANLPTIQNHGLTWQFMSSLTGKKIIADAGYGVAGNPDDNSGPWFIQSNLDNRIRDGLGAVTIAGPPRSPFYRPNVC